MALFAGRLDIDASRSAPTATDTIDVDRLTPSQPSTSRPPSITDSTTVQTADHRGLDRSGPALGALQNRFEHTINNLNVAVENLSASESRIRDTDMASEMVSFTRSQILSQAGTAMLAQANQAPQGVLQLLRG